jgi:N-acetylmuramoyl-L-alanine amidase
MYSISAKLTENEHMKPCKPRLRFKRPPVKRIWGCVIICLIINISNSFALGFSKKDSLGVRTVIIDPGHGGRDPGCLGAHSHEADVALAISLKLGKMLKDKYGDALNIVYTRTTDIHVDLAERAKMANKNKGDLFICIHANSGPSHAKGTETYVLGLHKEDAQFKVAQKENSVILMEDNYETKYSNFDPNDPDAYLIINYMTKLYLANSILFAEKIQSRMKSTPKIIDRGVKQAGFLVLHQVNMPSVLVETGFLTNPDEEKILNDVECQTNIATSIFDAFISYKEELENKNKSVINENTVSDTNNKDTSGKDNNTSNTNDSKNLVADTKDRVTFKVQIAASTKPIERNLQNFKGLENIEENVSGTTYRYTYGKTHNFEEAKKFQSVAREKGFATSFITAYLNGERIEMSKALELTNQ